MPLLSSNPMWEDFGQRALLWAPTGGADFGECLRTVQAISDDGSTDDWYREWTATADRVAGIADDCAARGQAEGDPIAAGASKLYDAVQAEKVLMRFAESEGAGGPCETMARSLYHQRVFDWLDEVLKFAGSAERW